MEQISKVIFYDIDKSIRSYRQFAQRRLKEAGLNITIDQWLLIKHIAENPGIKQQELGDLVFKDNASVTRIIELLVKAKYLKRKSNEEDRRRASLLVTKSGNAIISKVWKVVQNNRKIALKGIPKKDLEITKSVLFQIISNCNKRSMKNIAPKKTALSPKK